MAKINTYSDDISIDLNDKIIGTDAKTGLTNNYRVLNFLDYLGNTFNLQSSDLIYSYSDNAAASLQNGQISTNNFSSDPISTSSITNVFISKTTAFNENVESFLNTVSGDLFTIMLVDLDDYNNFALGTIVSISNVGSTGIMDMIISNKFSNGVLDNEKTIGLKLYPPTVVGTSSDINYLGDNPINYTPTGNTITGHLEGIDNRLSLLDSENIPLDTTNFNGILTSLEVNSQLAFNKIDDINSQNIPTDTSSFNRLLSASDTTVQSSLQTINNIQSRDNGFSGLIVEDSTGTPYSKASDRWNWYRIGNMVFFNIQFFLLGGVSLDVPRLRISGISMPTPFFSGASTVTRHIVHLDGSPFDHTYASMSYVLTSDFFSFKQKPSVSEPASLPFPSNQDYDTFFSISGVYETGDPQP